MSRKVMIVDDDEVSNFVCTSTIEQAGISNDIIAFLTARDALDFIEQAIANAVELLPDLILLDINMPVMNGWDFMEAYKKLMPTINKNIVIIILTSSVYQKDKEKAGTYAEISDFASKPLDTSVLLEFADKYLTS